MICVPSGVALPAIDIYDREHAKTTNDFGSGHTFTHARRLTASGRQARSAPCGGRHRDDAALAAESAAGVAIALVLCGKISDEHYSALTCAWRRGIDELVRVTRS